MLVLAAAVAAGSLLGCGNYGNEEAKGTASGQETEKDAEDANDKEAGSAEGEEAGSDGETADSGSEASSGGS